MNTYNYLESVIAQRLKLNTNQRILDSEFNVSFADLNKLKSGAFKKTFESWDQVKRNKFYFIVGGRTNFRETENYFKSILS